MSSLGFADRFERLVDPGTEDELAFNHPLVMLLEAVLAPKRGAELERTGTFPRAELEKAAQLGLFALVSPACAGGSLGWSRAMRPALRISAHDLDFALVLGGSILTGVAVLTAGSESQQIMYFRSLQNGDMSALALSEWGHGSDLLGNETYARPDAGHWKNWQKAAIYGEKAPINNGSQGAYVVVLARTGKENDPFGQSLFLVPQGSKNLRRERPFDLIGFRCLDLARISFDGTEVTPENLLGELHEGFSYARRTLEVTRSGVACVAAGALAKSVWLALDHAHTRRLYNAPIAELAAVRGLVARAVARLALAMALVRMTVRIIDCSPAAAPMWTSASKWLVPMLLEHTIRDAGMVIGARSLLEDFPFARLRRSAPLLGIFDGSAQLQLDELARHVARWPLDSPCPLNPDTAWKYLLEMGPLPFDANRQVDSATIASFTPTHAGVVAAESSRAIGALARSLVPIATSRRAHIETRHRVSECGAWLVAATAFSWMRHRSPELSVCEPLVFDEIDRGIHSSLRALGIRDELSPCPGTELDSATNRVFDWITAVRSDLT